MWLSQKWNYIGPGCRYQGCKNLTVSIELSAQNEDSDSDDQASDTSDSEQVIRR